MHPALRSRAERRYGLFTTAEALVTGYTHSEIRNLVASGRWTRLRRGVLTATADLDHAREHGNEHRVACLAVLLALGRPEAIVSHSSAARLWQVPSPADADGLVRVTDPHRWRRGEGYLMSRAPLWPADRWRTGPIRLTSAARTLVDCAREWPLDDAVVAMDAALLAGRLTPADLARAVEAARSWPGASRAVRAASLADGRAESPLETRGRLRIVGAGLPTPQLQAEIHARGRLVAVVDAWFDEAAVAVEFDGRVKYTDPWRDPGKVLWEEKRREDELRALDIRVMRVADDDVGRWAPTEARLRGLLARPGPAVRSFTAVPRTHGRRRAG
jgi:hypothetical protein